MAVWLTVFIGLGTRGSSDRLLLIRLDVSCGCVGLPLPRKLNEIEEDILDLGRGLGLLQRDGGASPRRGSGSPGRLGRDEVVAEDRVLLQGRVDDARIFTPSLIFTSTTALLSSRVTFCRRPRDDPVDTTRARPAGSARWRSPGARCTPAAAGWPGAGITDGLKPLQEQPVSIAPAATGGADPDGARGRSSEIPSVRRSCRARTVEISSTLTWPASAMVHCPGANRFRLLQVWAGVFDGTSADGGRYVILVARVFCRRSPGRRISGAGCSAGHRTLGVAASTVVAGTVISSRGAMNAPYLSKIFARACQRDEPRKAPIPVSSRGAPCYRCREA